jgi:hypothetical protein
MWVHVNVTVMAGDMKITIKQIETFVMPQRLKTGG